MATLERKKKPAPIQQHQQEQEEDLTKQEQDEQLDVNTNQHNDDADLITNDPILDSLSKEPMEYSAVCCLSPEIVQSLQSVKHICLNVLDSLLLQIVKDLPRGGHHQRRLSDQNIGVEAEKLLGSITENTNLLQSISMTRSLSSPPAMATATSISDVYRILDKHQPLNSINNQDYTLCCSLAALLDDVYRLLELNSEYQQQRQPQQEEQQQHVPVDRNDVSVLQQQLHDKVSDFQLKRAQGAMIMDETDASLEMIMIWDEMDHLMNIVTGLAKPPPNYTDLMLPPAYDSLMLIDGKEEHHVSVDDDKKKDDSSTSATINELDTLLSAIDRLSHVAPRLNNQTVELSQRQINELAAATLGRAVERLSRGRMEDQRAPLPLKSKQEVLQDLIQQIYQSASRSLDNQRVNITTSQQRKMDIASINGIMDKLDKGRYTDQDWISHEEMLINDLTRTTDLLVKSLNRPVYNRQRFSMSAAKERSLFMSGLFSKVENIEGNRLVNQDAELPPTSPPNNNNNEENEDLHQLLNHIYKSKPQLDNQRASFSQ